MLMEVSMRTPGCLLTALLFTTVSVLVGAEERHAVDPSAIAAAVAEHADRRIADRNAIRQTLDNEAVRGVAGRAGVDITRLRQSIDTLNEASLERVAAAARQVDRALTGGASTVTISTTTIIIGLLILILIIVAVD
jgi:hypothetical protein